MKRSLFIIIGLSFSLLVCSLPTKKPYDKRKYIAEKLKTKAPVIDGILDEAVWTTANRGKKFTQFEPSEGKDPYQPTEFAIRYDDNNIYVGIWAIDSYPDSISRRLTRRDQIDGDFVGVDFDSYFDHRTSFGFWVSASGVKMDRIASNDGDTEDTGWDPIWFVKTSINDEGWTAEMKIPLSQLRFGENENKIWGFEIIRMIFRKEELSLWQPIPRNTSGWVHQFAELHGIKDINPKKQFDITPYTVGSFERYEKVEGNPFETGKGQNLSAGFDAKIGLTNNMTLDLAANPDFGQVEADPSQVNLSAYETFFAEKRPFFIEGRSILSMPLMIGDGDLANENLFYTRRIGRSPQGYHNPASGEYVDTPEFTRIIGSAKLTTKTSRGLSIGVMEAVVAEQKAEIDLDGKRSFETIEPLTNYIVGSVHKDFDDGNTVISGLVTATNRKLKDTPLDYLHSDAYTGGLDFTQYFKDKTYMLAFKTYFSQVKGSTEAITRTQESSARYYHRVDADHLELDTTRTSLFGNGGSILIGKVGNAKFQYGAFLNWKTPGVELNDIGYIRQVDQIIQILWSNYQFTEPFSIFRSLSINGSQWASWDFSGTYMGLGANINANTQFKNYWSLHTGINASSSALSSGMLRGGPAFIRPLNYTSNFNISSDNRKKIRFNFGGFFPRGIEGHSKTNAINMSITYRPTNNLVISLSPNYMSGYSNLQYIQETSYNDETRYIFGAIDQKILGMSMRINLTLSPNFTIEYWGQPFFASGKYSDIKMITDPLADEYADRYHSFTDEEMENIDGFYHIDENNDKAIDYYIENQDFNRKEFKSNLVARWEYRPGSILYLVWSQGRSGTHSYGDFEFGRDVGDLYDVKPYNIFLIKLSYRLGK
ncbi:DUF5916 domain-containing protein [Bacteroidota bacterium]